MWKMTICSVIIWFSPLCIFAQEYQELRDSLAVATDRLAYHPDSTDLRLRKAGFNLELEQWQYAKEEYDYILRRHPENIAALYFRAYANERLHRNHFAKLDYENLLSMLPTHFEARLGLALLCLKMGRTTDAFDNINMLIEQHPDSAIAYAARAGMEVERKMDEMAEYDYTEALRREPTNTDYLLNRAIIRIRLQRKEDARTDLERLVELGLPRYSLQDFFSLCK